MSSTHSSTSRTQKHDHSTGTHAQKLVPTRLASDKDKPPRVLVLDGNRLGARSISAQAAKENETTSGIKADRKRKIELLEKSPKSATGGPSKISGRTVFKVQKLALANIDTSNMRSSSKLNDRSTPLATQQNLPIKRTATPSLLELRSTSINGNHETLQESFRNELEARDLKKEVNSLKLEIAQAQKAVKVHSETVDDLRKQLKVANKTILVQNGQMTQLTRSIKSSKAKLDSVHANLTCQICLEVLSKPHTLHPCGHVFCQCCLQNWFRTAPLQPEDEVGTPVIQRRKTCPGCRDMVHSRPVPLYVLKSIVSAFVPEDLVGELLGDDPWKEIFPLIHISTNLADDDSDNDLSSHDDSEDEDDSDSDGEVGPPQWTPALFTSAMIRRLYPQVTSNDQIQLCKRGATPGMIERFHMRFDEEHGIIATATRYNNAQVYLGWNIKLHPDDEDDGLNFMEWVESNIIEVPELWRSERGERGPGQIGLYRRVLPRVWGGEVLLDES